MFSKALEDFKHLEPDAVGFTDPGNVPWHIMSGCLVKSIGYFIVITVGEEEYRVKLLCYYPDQSIRVLGSHEGRADFQYTAKLSDLQTIVFPGWVHTLKGDRQ